MPQAFIFEPWTMPADVQSASGVLIGDHYPEPVVDHLATAAFARNVLWKLRRNPDVRSESMQVFHRHGSRNPMREGQAHRATRSAKSATAKDTPQLPLALDVPEQDS